MLPFNSCFSKNRLNVGRRQGSWESLVTAYRMPALFHEGNQLGGRAAPVRDIEAGPLWGFPVLVCHSMQYFLQCNRSTQAQHAGLAAETTVADKLSTDSIAEHTHFLQPCRPKSAQSASRMGAQCASLLS